MKKNLKISLAFLILLWIIEIFDFITPFSLDNFGIRPLQIPGLKGILFAPFLHGGFQHLMSNSIPIVILMWTILTFYDKIWWQVTVFSVIFGGIGVWFFGGSGTVHIGASGLIFSLIGFLLASGIFRKNLKAFFIALVIFLLYGGTLFFGVLPGRPGVSWQGHFFGAIAGIVLAWVYRKPNVKKNKEEIL